MTTSQRATLIKSLQALVTESRFSRISSVCAQRSRRITVAIEDIFQPHNTSAVLRSCDCYGIQDVHIIEDDNEFVLSEDIALGSSNWLDIHRYNEGDARSQACIDNLRTQGYLIVATSPHVDAYTPMDIPLDRPIALFFGTEKDGLKPSTLDAADVHMRIPMYGFTESFNISVSAALCLSHIRHRLEAEEKEVCLPIEEREELLIKWLSRDVRGGEEIVRAYQSAL